LEDITPQTINCFLSQRLQKNGWSAKTANLMRQILHKLFSYAIKHHGFRSRDPRYINPAAFVERRLETAPHIRFLSLEDIEEQLESLKTDCTIYALVSTYIYAGLRREGREYKKKYETRNKSEARKRQNQNKMDSRFRGKDTKIARRMQAEGSSAIRGHHSERIRHEAISDILPVRRTWKLC
jgi:hypothetical protein